MTKINKKMSKKETEKELKEAINHAENEAVSSYGFVFKAPKNYQFNTRLTKLQDSILKLLQSKTGVPKSTIVRTLIISLYNSRLADRLLRLEIRHAIAHDHKADGLFDAISRVTTALNWSDDQIARVGNNLNQLVRAIHSGEFPTNQQTQLIVEMCSHEVTRHYHLVHKEREALDADLDELKKEAD